MYARAVYYIVQAQLTKIVIGLVAQIIIARMLLPEGRGVYAICFATSTLLLVLTHFGNEYGIRYLLVSKRITSAQAFRYLVLTAATSMILTLCFISAMEFLGILANGKVTYQHLLLACLLSISQLVTTQINVFMTVRGQYLEASILAVFEETLKLISVVALIFVMPTVESALVAAIFANIFIISYTIVRYGFLARDFAVIRLSDIKFIYKYGLQSFWLNLSGISTSHMGTLILSSVMSYGQIGIYNLAFGLITRFQVFPDAIARVLVPASMASTDEEERFNMIQLSMTSFLALSVMFALIFGLFYEQVIAFFFGREYAEAGIVAFILFLGFMFKVICKPLEIHFNEIIGTPKVVAGIQFFSIISMALLTYLGAVTFGLNGAAVGSSVALVLGAVIFLFVYKSSTKRPISSLIAPRLIFERFALLLKR